MGKDWDEEDKKKDKKVDEILETTKRFMDMIDKPDSLLNPTPIKFEPMFELRVHVRKEELLKIAKAMNDISEEEVVEVDKKES